MLDFVRALWEVPVEGDFTVFFAKGKSTESLHVPLPDLLAEQDGVAAQADLEKLAKGRNVYFGLALRVPGLAPMEQGGKEDVFSLPGFALDIDIADDAAHRNKNLPKDDDQAIQILAACPHAPSAVVHSGHGLQVFWFFDQPLIWSPGKFERVEELMRQFHAPFGARAASLGLHLDELTTAQRVWRLPGFMNVKDPENHRRAEIIALDRTKRYRVEQLVATGSYPAAQAAVAAGPAGLISPPPRVEVSQAGGAPLSSGNIDDVVKYLRVLSNPISRAVWNRILSGMPFAEEGGREETLRDATVCLLGLRSARECTDHQLAELFRSSIERMAVEQANPANPPPDMGDVMYKLRTARDYVVKREAKEQASLQTLNRIMNDRREPDDPLVPVREPETEINPRHSIIVHNSAFYVYNEITKQYSPPKVTKDDVTTYLRDAWIGGTRELRYVSGDQVKAKTLAMLLDSYGTSADDVVYRMGIDRSYYDPNTRTFFQAVSRPRRDLVPEFVPEIDRWFRLLFAGDHLEKALDWVATLTFLTRQTCALYLSGPASVGKTWLAFGLARIWTGDRGPTEYAKIVGNFNDDLIRCPLVFADEYLPETKEQPFARVREMTGTSVRTISKKHVANATLLGAVRVLVCANRDSLFASANDMSQHELEATCRRILHIPVGDEAAQHLAEVGMDRTAQWVNDDLIAKHALWLRDNRKVDMSGRFLVEGPVTQANRRLLNSGGLSDLVSEWCVRYALDPGPVQMGTIGDAAPKARMGDGFIFVNTDAVVDYWDDYVRPRGSRPPSSGRVSRILTNHSMGTDRYWDKKQRRPTIRYHKIDADSIRRFAEEHNIGDVDILMENINRPVEENDPKPKKMHAIAGGKVEKPLITPPDTNGHPIAKQT